jgi:hypothetical protein
MGIRGDMAFDMDNDGDTMREAYTGMGRVMFSIRTVGDMDESARDSLKKLKKGKK